MVTVTANESSAIDLTFEFLSYGWTISGKKAIHEACNSGPILTTKIKFVVGKSYEIGFIVSGYVSGNVYPVLGNTTGTAVMANGTFKQVLLCTVNDKLQFISNGNLVIEYLEAIPQDGLLVDNGATIEFNEEENKITSYFS